MKKIIFLILMIMPFMTKANHWQPDPYQFESNMTVTGVLHFDDVEQRNASIEIGAFYDGVCRGSSMVQYIESLDRYYVFMMIYGYYGDSISFKCYDHNRNIELEMIGKSYIEFKSNDIIGNASEPFIFAFDSYKHYVNIDMIPEMTAVITGDGEYKKYDTCFISITPNQGYQLDALLEDNDTVTKQHNYSFIVLSDKKFVAHLSEMPIYYQINAYANPETGGTILGTGEYLENETCTLQVITNPGYDYLGLYENDELVTTETSYTLTADSNRNFRAEFSLQINYYQVSAQTSPNGAGIVSGLGAYQEYDTCHLEITPNEGYDFLMLKEGATIVSYEPSYSFEVLSDRHFNAVFALKEYQITLSANPEAGGMVSGSGTYTHGQTVYAIAVPNENYIFEKWTDAEGTFVTANNQYVFEATEDVNLVAHFKSTESIDETYVNDLFFYPNPASDFINISGLEKEAEMTIYDLMGKIVLKTSVESGDNMIDISNISNGTYIIAVDGKFNRIVINR